MFTADHVATVELLCAREFPAQQARSGSVVSGPGYHWAELSTSESFWEDDGSRRDEAEAQYEAECDAVALILGGRWGEPQTFGLGSLFERSCEGEDIPEPWNRLSNSVPYLHLWHVEGRWIGLGVSQWDTELEFQLVAVITETDPP